MFDDLIAMTALPNLHPAIVHFPIALSVVALLFDAALWFRWYSAPVDRSAAALWLLAALGAGAAYLAGEQAADGLGELTPAVEAALTRHADAALKAACALGALSLLRAWLAWRDGSEARTARNAAKRRHRRDALRVVALLGALIVQALVAYTADRGGALVYCHAVAVSAQPAARAPAATTTRSEPPAAAANSRHPLEVMKRLSSLQDGSLVWRPRAEDRAALGSILIPVGEAAVNTAASPAEVEGLSLQISGPTLLLFPAVPHASEDVALEVACDLSAFDGTIGLGARVEGDSSGGFALVRSDGVAKLVARTPNAEETLDRQNATVHAGTTTLGLSAVGRHWKGFVDGVSVVHGHSHVLVSGRTALLLDGTGTVRLISVRISPVSEKQPHES